ncbi:MAG: MBL fold metallo-hydrolase [Deltaproteobacteria bacterium]|nr:MBL fold metallo-hydrolase [Deltaproteobacteria bacterium]
MITLKPANRVEILSVMDNSLDVLMSSTPVAKRAPRLRDAFSRPQLRAEHGVSMLVTVESGEKKDAFLFDTGVSVEGALHNMDVLEVKPPELHAIVLSHGHTDHTRGLIGLTKRYGRGRLPIVLHPDAFLKRKNILPDGHEAAEHIPPDRRDLEAEGFEVIEERGPTVLMEGIALITGQITRTTPFEKGHPFQHAEVNGQWEKDPWIHDDQAVVIHVKDKGLVVLTGCGHAGMINTLLHARTITGVQEIYAVIGGFHLTGSIFEPIIPPTIQALQEIGPKVVVPQHCTGWKATFEIARQFPQAFIPTSVGTRYVL